MAEGRLRTVEGIPVVAHAVEVAVFSCEQNCPAGRADGVGDEAVFEQRPLFRQPVDVRRADERAAVAADGLLGVVVRHDEEDVGPFFGKGRAACCGQGDQRKNKVSQYGSGFLHAVVLA